MKKSMSDILAQLLIMFALIIIPITQIITCVRMSYANDRLKELIRIERQSNFTKQWQKVNPRLQHQDTLYFKAVKE